MYETLVALGFDMSNYTDRKIALDRVKALLLSKGFDTKGEYWIGDTVFFQQVKVPIGLIKRYETELWRQDHGRYYLYAKPTQPHCFPL
jgi:hypothetical protein